MEPHLFRWGNPARQRPCRTHRPASMEPHLFRWGNTPRSTSSPPAKPCLNGAPPIQVGKLGRGRDVEDLSRKPQWSPTYSGGETPRTGRGQFPHGGASMEPHLFRWGNRPATPSPSTSPTGLNGAPPIQVGKPGVVAATLNAVHEPQWSPTYSGGETALS